MRHPCNAKQSSKSRNFTWLFLHALVTILHLFFKFILSVHFLHNLFKLRLPTFTFYISRWAIFVLNYLLYYFSTNINLFTVHYLVAHCGILPVGSILTRPSPVCPHFPFYTSWGKPFFILNHLYSTFQLTLVFLQAQTSPSCHISSRYVFFFISFYSTDVYLDYECLPLPTTQIQPPTCPSIGLIHATWNDGLHRQVHAPNLIADFHRKHPGAARCIRTTEFNSIPFQWLVPTCHLLEGGGMLGDSWLKPNQSANHSIFPPIADCARLQTCTFQLTVDLYISFTYFIMPFPFIIFILVPLFIYLFCYLHFETYIPPHPSWDP